jgi:hypothetical protein
VKRGVLTVESLKERCIVDPATHCWLWQGAYSTAGTPRLHTIDYARQTKRSMSGPLAAWNIAHGEAPPHWALVFRGCQNRRCLNPAHLRLARDNADIGLHIRRAGTRKGKALQSCRENILKAHQAIGTVFTPRPVVLAIKQAPKEVRNVQLAAQFGMAPQTVSRIRRGETYAGVGAA